MNFFKNSQTNWRYILIVVTLVAIIGGGILWFSAKQEISIEFPEIKKPEEVVKDETANRKTYKNKEYNFEFEYPGEWGVIMLKPQNNEKLYVFNSTNEKIRAIFYHKPSGNLAFVMLGEKYEMDPSVAFYYNEKSHHQEILKTIFPNKEIKTVYTVSTTTKWDIVIDDIEFSPDGKYISFMLSGFEFGESFLVNVNNGLNILEKHTDTGYGRVYWSIYWSPTGTVLAIQNHFMEEYGEEKLLVSEYGDPEKLKKVFSIGEYEERFGGSKIYDLHFVDDNKLIFSVFLKRCKYSYEEGVQCSDEGKTTKYEYDTKMKELKEIEEKQL